MNSSNRIWVIGAAIVAVAVLALGYFLGVAPRLAEKQAADDQAAIIETQNAQYSADLASLKEQYDGIDDIRAELEKLRLTLPADASIPEYVQEIENSAALTGNTVVSIITATPVVYGATDAASSTAGTAPISGGNLVAIPVTVTVNSGNPDAPLQFMNKQRLGQRLFLAGTVSYSVVPQDDKTLLYQIVIEGFIYSLVDPADIPTVGADGTVVDPSVPIVETPAPTTTPTP